MSDTSSQDSGQKRGRKKATGFPVVHLDEAATVLREAGRYGRQQSVDTFAGYMGHSTTNSGAFRQRMAAFRDWGLISGRGDVVEITDLGWRIAHPVSAEDELAALRQAFRTANVFRAMYDASTHGTPLLLNHLGNIAVQKYGVGPNWKSRFAESFAYSAAYARLAERTDDKVVLVDESEEVPEPRPPVARQDTTSEVSAQPAEPAALAPSAPAVLRNVWTLRSGELIFEVRSHEPINAAAFIQVAKVVELLEVLATALGSGCAGGEEAAADQAHGLSTRIGSAAGSLPRSSSHRDRSLEELDHGQDADQLG